MHPEFSRRNCWKKRRGGSTQCLTATNPARLPASNGEEAVERVLELKPDLVILDVTMPVLNGLQAARKIRSIAPRVKILILSMHDSPQLASEALRLGADAYLIKSGPQVQLLETIANLLRS
jgi:DNA-binding NarL/FixJ family response regulator